MLSRFSCCESLLEMILPNLDNLSCVKKFLVNGGYSGERFADQVKEICGAQVEAVKRSELHKFVVLPRRWVVERLSGWLANSAGFGKVANANFLPLPRSLRLHSLPSLLEDFKQALSVVLETDTGDNSIGKSAFLLIAAYVLAVKLTQTQPI